MFELPKPTTTYNYPSDITSASSLSVFDTGYQTPGSSSGGGIVVANSATQHLPGQSVYSAHSDDLKSVLSEICGTLPLSSQPLNPSSSGFSEQQSRSAQQEIYPLPQQTPGPSNIQICHSSLPTTQNPVAFKRKHLANNEQKRVEEWVENGFTPEEIIIRLNLPKPMKWEHWFALDYGPQEIMYLEKGR